jgi:thiol-disulfide isomerase/thioredoxin
MIRLLVVLLALTLISTSFYNKKKVKKYESWEQYFDENLWLKEGIDNYFPDTSILNQLHLPKEQQWILFVGNWCSDTRDLLPKFLKVAKLKNWNIHIDALFALGPKKKGKVAKEFKVTKVPTFVLINNQKEIGRIEESVNESIEKALLELCKTN